MNTISGLIFIIGPGAVGKTTVGKVLAAELGYAFVDIDDEFCKRIALIGEYIADHGYEAYCDANSALFEKLLREYPSHTVFPLSSGFLVHEHSPQLVKKHISLLQKHGISILLLPSRQLQASIDLVVSRQLAREYMKTSKEKEIQKLTERFYRYKEHGDIQIFSHARPEVIAMMMMTALQNIQAM